MFNGNGRVGLLVSATADRLPISLATKDPRFEGGRALYGGAPALDAVPNIKAEVLVHHASKDDERLVAGWPKYEEALKAAGEISRLHLRGRRAWLQQRYDPRFDSNAARLAWARTLEVFNRCLRS